MTTNTSKGHVMTMIRLKRSYELVCGTGRESNQAELRDAARNGLVVHRGTYAECVEEAKARGLWHS